MRRTIARPSVFEASLCPPPFVQLSRASDRRTSRRSADGRRGEVGIVQSIGSRGLLAAKQISTRPYVAVDRTHRAFVPTDVERGELGKELQAAVGQMVVDPIGERSPVRALGIAVGEPRYHDAGRRSAETGC